MLLNNYLKSNHKAQTPDDADFPLSEAGSRDLERSHAPNAEKDQQPGTEELCDALAF